MLKQFKIGILALLAVGFFACQSGNNAVREEAREDVTSNVQPATPGQPATPAATPEANAVPAGPTTTIEFKETTFDFGTIDEGEKVSHTFVFTNTGNEPLIFSNAKGSCGCTVPQWPREAIAPGATSEIKVDFNSKNKKGKRNQKVTLTANTNPPQTFIYLTGNVNAAAGAETKGNPQIQISQ